MPTYPYACTACDHRFEQVQAFSDPSLTECPVCGGRLRKVFSSVGIVFKGSGFYRNDARGNASSSESSSEKSEKSEKSDTKTEKSGASAEKSGGAEKSGAKESSSSSSSASTSTSSSSSSSAKSA